jgi:hypothetical protein
MCPSDAHVCCAWCVVLGKLLLFCCCYMCPSDAHMCCAWCVVLGKLLLFCRCYMCPSDAHVCCAWCVVLPLVLVACFVLEVLECLLGWTDSAICNMIVSLSVVHFLYYLEYRVVGVDACILHLYSVFSHLI